MVVVERAESLDVLVAGFAAGLAGDVIEAALGVDRVVEDDSVDDQSERAELFFLALVVGLAELAAAAVADVAGEAVADSGHTNTPLHIPVQCFRVVMCSQARLRAAPC